MARSHKDRFRGYESEHELLIILFDTSPQSKKQELANYSLLDFCVCVNWRFLFILFNTAGNIFQTLKNIQLIKQIAHYSLFCLK